MISFGFNVRSTIGFVTDSATCTYLTEADVYPIARTINGQSVTFGWVAAPTGQTRDRDSAADPRLAGSLQMGVGEGFGIFPVSLRVDLPATGGWDINLAMGDQNNARDCTGIIKDNAATLATITGDTVVSNSYVDAAGNVLNAATWITSNTPRTCVFSSTTCFINTDAITSIGGFAHVFFTQRAVVFPRKQRGLNGGMLSLAGGMNS